MLQVFRAIRSILYGFVAFFTTCNRHRLRYGLSYKLFLSLFIIIICNLKIKCHCYLVTFTSFSNIILFHAYQKNSSFLWLILVDVCCNISKFHSWIFTLWPRPLNTMVNYFSIFFLMVQYGKHFSIYIPLCCTGYYPHVCSSFLTGISYIWIIMWLSFDVCIFEFLLISCLMMNCSIYNHIQEFLLRLSCARRRSNRSKFIAGCQTRVKIPVSLKKHLI